MKLLSFSRNKLLLQLGKREKHLLFELLKLYPRIPPAHHKLTRSSRLPDQEASQKLLDEALAEQRAENKKHSRRCWLTRRECRKMKPAAGCHFREEILNGCCRCSMTSGWEAGYCWDRRNQNWN